MFKRCTNCETKWADRDDFLSDPDVVIIGYQVDFEDLRLGYFLFNHMSCKTTMAIHSVFFIELYRGPVFTQPKTGSSECPEHCLHKDDLEPCAAACECAYVRDIIQIIRRWPTRAIQNDQALRA